MKATLYFRAIEARFIGPTNFKGQRISVRWADKQGARKVYNWDYEQDAAANYELAATRFYNQVSDTREGERAHNANVKLEGGHTDRGAMFCIRFSRKAKR